MKIDNIGNGIKSLVTVAESESRPAKRQAPDAPASADVHLSSLATHLNQAEQALAGAPVVNAKRVAELTQAIREDRFTVDASKVAANRKKDRESLPRLQSFRDYWRRNR